MAPSVWQQLGAFVYTGQNLSEDTVAKFAGVGGAWIVPVLYGDDSAGPWNLSNISTLKAMCARHNVRVGLWADCWAKDPENDAVQIAALVNNNGLTGPIQLDCEAAYQQNPDVFPQLLKRVRNHLPHANLSVSTNSLNDSLIWNGRGLTPQQSARKLGYRVAPQWYNSPNYSGCWTDPVCNMKWLWENGSKDNFYDKDYANHRAVPLSYVHPTLEVTGLEQSILASELNSLLKAKAWGFTSGLSLYTLENTPDSDWPLLAAQRGTLYL